MKIKSLMFASMMTIGSMFSFAHAEEIGSVDTAFKLLGANHKVVVEVFDDNSVQGVSCYISRAKTGGISGSLGVAEDKSEASIACVQTGEIIIKGALKKQDKVFSQSTSILFKSLSVNRFVDVKRNALIYVTTSDKLIDGSPKNSITVVYAGKPIPVK